MLETFIIQVDGTFWKALELIDVTDSGIVIDVREEQFENASMPIEFTFSGISIVVRDLQSLKK